MRNKPYVQFSKRCVVSVLISVDVIIIIALAGMISNGDFSSVGEVVKAFLQFSSVVFVSYCGNSAIEKCVTKWSEKSSVSSSDNFENG